MSGGYFGSRYHLRALIAEYEAWTRGEIPERPHSVAEHESGHVVVAFAQGGKIPLVTIVPELGMNGHTAAYPFIDEHASQRTAAVSWGGALATGTLFGAFGDMDRV